MTSRSGKTLGFRTSANAEAAPISTTPANKPTEQPPTFYANPDARLEGLFRTVMDSHQSQIVLLPNLIQIQSPRGTITIGAAPPGDIHMSYTSPYPTEPDLLLFMGCVAPGPVTEKPILVEEEREEDKLVLAVSPSLTGDEGE